MGTRGARRPRVSSLPAIALDKASVHSSEPLEYTVVVGRSCETPVLGLANTNVSRFDVGA